MSGGQHAAPKLDAIVVLRGALVRTHVKAQALRFARLFVITLAGQMLLLDPNGWSRAALVSVLVSAAEVAVRQAWPALPLPQVAGRLAVARAEGITIGTARAQAAGTAVVSEGEPTVILSNLPAPQNDPGMD